MMKMINDKEAAPRGNNGDEGLRPCQGTCFWNCIFVLVLLLGFGLLSGCPWTNTVGPSIGVSNPAGTSYSNNYDGGGHTFDWTVINPQNNTLASVTSNNPASPPNCAAFFMGDTGVPPPAQLLAYVRMPVINPGADLTCDFKICFLYGGTTMGSADFFITSNNGTKLEGLATNNGAQLWSDDKPQGIGKLLVASLNPSLWHHAVMTRHSNGNVDYFWDGILVASAVPYAPIGQVILTQSFQAIWVELEASAGASWDTLVDNVVVIN